METGDSLMNFQKTNRSTILVLLLTFALSAIAFSGYDTPRNSNGSITSKTEWVIVGNRRVRNVISIFSSSKEGQPQLLLRSARSNELYLILSHNQFFSTQFKDNPKAVPSLKMRRFFKQIFSSVADEESPFLT